MANDWFVDAVNGAGGNSGATLDLAWDTIRTAMTHASVSAGDYVWVRRGALYATGISSIDPIKDGTVSAFIHWIGGPRPAITKSTITQASWTNGSKDVKAIVGITLTRLGHCGRYVTAPDGKQYMITRVGFNLDGTTDADALVLMTPYQGATVTGTDGKFQIEADSDYQYFQDTVVDGTITKADWNADTHDMYETDFEDSAYNLSFSSDLYQIIKNLAFKDSSDGAGIVSMTGCNYALLEGCLLKQTAENDPIFTSSTQHTFLRRCVFEGSTQAADSTQRAINIALGRGWLQDVAAYGCGDVGLYVYASTVYGDNCNFGVELANEDDDIGFRSGGKAFFTNTELGGTNGTVVSWSDSYDAPYEAHFENYNRSLGANRTFFLGGLIEKVAQTDESATIDKKVSDDVIQITTPLDKQWELLEPSAEIFEHVFVATASAKTYKYWIFNDAFGTLNSSDAKGNIWLEISYIDEYTSVSQYKTAIIYSTETDILNAGSTSDWDFLSGAAVTPAVGSLVRIKMFFRGYSASGSIYVDPAVVIS